MPDYEFTNVSNEQKEVLGLIEYGYQELEAYLMRLEAYLMRHVPVSRRRAMAIYYLEISAMLARKAVCHDWNQAKTDSLLRPPVILSGSNPSPGIISK